MDELKEEISNKLLIYQRNHTKSLIKVINENKSCLDASDTGTGKTYCAIALCAQLKYNPIILCPKSVIYTWKNVCEFFNINPKMIVNYETIRMGKYYDNKYKRIKCPYIEFGENEDNKEYYKWKKLDDNDIFIFDEVHRCQDIRTYTGKLLYGAKTTTNNPILILSATLADLPKKFNLFFYILNFISPEEVKNKRITYEKYIEIMESWLERDKKPFVRIHNMLYPERASRMRIDALGSLFPETQIVATPYTIGREREKEIEKEYNIIAGELDKLQDKKFKDKANILVRIMRGHQKIELLKIPIFVELANDFLEAGVSVVIFVNFTQTLKTLSKMLNTECLIYGEQTGIQRENNINDFQSNKSKIIICNIKAGSVGLSLHDIHGGHRRASLISPTFNAIEIVQALGRIHRAGGKSKSLQRIIYCANTVEEKIAEKIRKKLGNINSLNNGDLDFTNIIFERDRRN